MNFVFIEKCCLNLDNHIVFYTIYHWNHSRSIHLDLLIKLTFQGLEGNFDFEIWVNHLKYHSFLDFFEGIDP
jgi:hypothetical protein